MTKFLLIPDIPFIQPNKYFNKMIRSKNIITDTEILLLIEQNDPLAWKYLYDKYALMMYVTILWVLDDDRLAEDILVLMFAQLKMNKSMFETKKTLGASLLYHTYVTALKVLNTNTEMLQRAVMFDAMYQQINGWVYRYEPLTESAPAILSESAYSEMEEMLEMA